MLERDNDISPDLFVRVGKNSGGMEAIVRPNLTYFQDAWRRLKENRIAVGGLAIIAFYALLAVIGPMLVPWDFRTNLPGSTDLPPSAAHWFGTDTLGRDLWARTWMGARVSLTIGFVAALLNSVIGVVVGGIAGYFGGRVDMVIMRIIDVLYGIPYIIIAILAMVVLGPGINTLIIAMVAIGWIGSARLVRGQVMQLNEQEFVLASKILGASHARIILRHLIPNVFGLIITNLTMAVPYFIFSEAFLSFIGLGVQPPYSSWGQLAKYGSQSFRVAPWELFIPAFFISTTMLSLNLLGDGLRDALDPKLRGTVK